VSQNLVIANKDNKVVFVFGGIDLTLATDILVVFGSESYTKLLNPTVVVVASASELSLDLSATAEVGKVFATVTYKDASSVYGTDITSRQLGNSDKIVVAIGSQLIVEDGTIVANANSFNTDAEFMAYANIRNVEIPSTEPDRDALQIKAVDYLISREQSMKGTRVSDLQELPYPRFNVRYNGYYITGSEIPKELKNAQNELAIQAYVSDLLISKTTDNVQSISLDGVISKSFFSGGSYSTIRTDKADAYLDVLMNNNGNNNLVTRM
jgi:hypothetical protein